MKGLKGTIGRAINITTTISPTILLPLTIPSNLRGQGPSNILQLPIPNNHTIPQMSNQAIPQQTSGTHTNRRLELYAWRVEEVVGVVGEWRGY